jgi:hypothetical protein
MTLNCPSCFGDSTYQAAFFAAGLAQSTVATIPGNAQAAP